MKRKQWHWLVVAACLCLAVQARAQMGMNLFKKPNITDIFKPVVGRRVAQTINCKTILGAAYAGFACAGLE